MTSRGGGPKFWFGDERRQDDDRERSRILSVAWTSALFWMRCAMPAASRSGARTGWRWRPPWAAARRHTRSRRAQPPDEKGEQRAETSVSWSRSLARAARSPRRETRTSARNRGEDAEPEPGRVASACDRCGQPRRRSGRAMRERASHRRSAPRVFVRSRSSPRAARRARGRRRSAPASSRPSAGDSDVSLLAGVPIPPRSLDPPRHPTLAAPLPEGLPASQGECPGPALRGRRPPSCERPRISLPARRLSVTSTTARRPAPPGSSAVPAGASVAGLPTRGARRSWPASPSPLAGHARARPPSGRI